MTKWSESLRRELERAVFRDGVKSVAFRIPAGRATVYRLIAGKVERPSMAIRSGVERLVRESSQVRHPAPSETE